MGKNIKFILAVTLVLSLAGCGNQGNTQKAAEANPVVEEKDNPTEKLENGDALAAEEENIEQENTKSENTKSENTKSENTASYLTADQIEDAKQAALAYYESTVFSVNSIEYLEGELPYGDMVGGCNFTVNVSKNGVVQEPDRTISLQPDQNGWKVVNEGY